MTFIRLIVLSMLLCDLLWWGWAHWRLRAHPARRAWRWALAAFMGMQTACLVWIIIGRIYSERVDEAMPRVLVALVFLWHFIALPCAVLLGIAELTLGGVVAGIRRLRRATPVSDVAPNPGRRQFLRAAVVSIPPVATVVMTGVSSVQMTGFRVRPFVLSIPQLPVGLDGLTIAHVTDIHVGSFTTESTLRRIIDATNNLRPDLVLMTGDLINHALSDLPGALDAVRRLDARHGVYMCEGNHDLIESRSGFEQTVRKSGVPLLLDETCFVPIRGQTVQLLGQRWVGRGDNLILPSAQRLVSLQHPGAFPILLAHHPHSFDVAADAGVPLTLAGHTHGGQLMATSGLGFGPLMFRYWSGLYRRGQSSLLVSNGVGNWFPLRIGAPAEILHITLRCA